MAIGFDAAVDGGLTLASTTLTWAHTCSGTDRCLIVNAFGATGSNDITSVTYNGVAMTLIAAPIAPSDRACATYRLANPASGANNIVVTASGTTIGGVSASYTGVHQTSPVDSSGNASTTGATSVTAPLAPVNDDVWVCLATKNSTGAAAAGTGATLRVSSGNGGALFDSNAPQPSGVAYNITATRAASSNWAYVVFGLVPAASGGSTYHRLPLLGAG